MCCVASWHDGEFCVCAQSKVCCKSMWTCRTQIVNFTVSVANSILHCQALAHFGSSDLASCFTQVCPLHGSCPSLIWSQSERRRLLGGWRTCCDGFYFSLQYNFKNLDQAKEINIFAFHLNCPTGSQIHRDKSDRFLNVFKKVLQMLDYFCPTFDYLHWWRCRRHKSIKSLDDPKKSQCCH